MPRLTSSPADYTLANPDTLTKYNNAAGIAQRVLAEVTKLAVPGATILSLCQKGDELLEAETSKIYKGKKISKGPLPVLSTFAPPRRMLSSAPC